jgi:hypothetical protein
MYKKIITLFVLYFIVVFFHYYAPFFVSQILITILLVLFYRSNDNSFWYALFTFISYSPGYLLTSVDPLHQSFYLIHPLFSLQFFLFFIIVVKYLSSKNKVKVFHTNLLYFIFSTFLIFVSFSFNYEINRIILSFLGILQISYIWMIPALFSNIDEFKKYFLYLLSFTPFIILCQVLYFLTGKHTLEFLGGVLYDEGFSTTSTYASEALLRPLYSSQILVINIFAIAFFISDKSIYGYNKNHLGTYLLFGILSIFSFFLSATRGYSFFALTILLYILFVVFKSRTLALKRIVIISAIIIFIFIFVANIVSLRFDLILSRLSTVVDFAMGDVSAGGTNMRITDRAPVVMAHFWYSPIIGYGYSSIGNNVFDGHVAVPSTLLVGGSLGFFVTIIFFIGNFIVINQIMHRRVKILSYIVLVSFILLHLFSYMQWHFLPKSVNSFALIIFLAFIYRIIFSPHSYKTHER